MSYLESLHRCHLVRSVRSGVRLASKLTKQAHVHQMLGVVIIVAHASEIARVVSHISIWHLLAATLLFGLWLLPENRVEGLK